MLINICRSTISIFNVNCHVHCQLVCIDSISNLFCYYKIALSVSNCYSWGVGGGVSQGTPCTKHCVYYHACLRMSNGNKSLHTESFIVLSVCTTNLKPLTCQVNFGPENFGPGDQNS